MYSDNDEWGYNGDAVHDMWVDYTTDMYEGTNYSGENDHAPEAHSYRVTTPQRRHKKHKVVKESTTTRVERYASHVRSLEAKIAKNFAEAISMKERADQASGRKKKEYKLMYEAAQTRAIQYQNELDAFIPRYQSAIDDYKDHLFMTTFGIGLIGMVISTIAVLAAL